MIKSFFIRSQLSILPSEVCCYLFTAEILPAPAVASPPARTRDDSVAFMDVDAAAVLLVDDDVVFVVRFIMLLLSSPITMVEPVLLRALDAVPFCC